MISKRVEEDQANKLQVIRNKWMNIRNWAEDKNTKDRTELLSYEQSPK